MADIDSQPLIEDLLWLYELSLATGHALDPQDSARHFLRLLVARRDLAGAGIWWRDADTSTLTLLDAVPRRQAPAVSLPLDHALWRLRDANRGRTFQRGEPGFAALVTDAHSETGACALLPLGDDGLLLMHSANAGALSARMLGQLRGVAAKLAVAIQGGLAHVRLCEATNAIRRASEKNLALLRNASDGIHILDSDGMLIEASDSFFDALGYRREELLGKNVASWDAAFNRTKLDRMLRLQLGKPRRHQFETRHRRKDNSIFEVEISGQPVELDGQRLLFNSSRDITARKRAETALRLSEERLAFAIQGASDGFWDWNLETDSVFYSPRWYEMLGYAPGELPETLATWAGLVHPEDKERTLTRVADYLGGRTDDFEVEFRMRRKDGSWLDILSRAKLTLDAEGRPLSPRRLIGTHVDITERKAAETALRRSEENHRSLIAALPDIIMRFDPQARHTFVSENIRELLPLQPADFIGRTHTDMGFPADMCALWEGAIHAVFERGAPNETEFSIEGSDGLRHFHWRLLPDVDERGGVRSVLTLAHDITRRKQAEAELKRHQEHLEALVTERTAELARAKDAAEAANLAKSAFLANMSHEIRTPMHAILGMAHLLRRSRLDDKQGDKLDKLEKAGKHLLEIINDVLDLSKIEAEKIDLADQPVDVAAIASDVLAIVGERVKAKGLRLAVALDRLPARLCGDSTRLQQALLNYVGNAVKFTEHGEIVLRALVAEEDKSSALLRFEVEDSGIGIPAEALGRLFSPFEQADNSTTRRYGGTGLGLAITRRLAEIMGGNAGASSSPGQGSCFWFTARLRKDLTTSTPPVTDGSASAESRLQNAHAGRCLLLVEDDALNRDYAAALLLSAGLRVELAADGMQALEMARRQAYDLILMDMQMPVMDGIKATQALRQGATNRDVPIVAMTANAYADDRALCMKAGMDDFVAKPVDPELLFATVERWLSKRRQ